MNVLVYIFEFYDSRGFEASILFYQELVFETNTQLIVEVQHSGFSKGVELMFQEVLNTFTTVVLFRATSFLRLMPAIDPPCLAARPCAMASFDEGGGLQCLWERPNRLEQVRAAVNFF